MTFGLTYCYRCVECHYHFEGVTGQDSILFMAETHINETNHMFGAIRKFELNDDWSTKTIYVKHSQYLGPNKRFKLREGVKQEWNN